MDSSNGLVALPSEVKYGGILGTNDLMVEENEGNLEDRTSEGVVARGMTTVVVENELRLGPEVCSQVLEWSRRGL